MIRLLILLLCATSLHAALNESIMLDAIAMVEMSSLPDTRGAAGERGMWQLMPKVRVHVGGHDRAAAHRWLKIVMKDMKKSGIYVCPYNVGTVWNAGITAVRKGRIPMSSYAYANRVDNLYRTLLRESLLTSGRKAD